METFWATLSVFGIVIIVMSVGVLFKRTPIKGSCGGIASVMGESGCDLCEMKNECQIEKRPLCDDHDCD
ncbi:MAG: (Na+)-NQR maturation NqrM [Bacteriovoracaceae bacterium]|nr:(Na+)-NQR maturation NqrM [Bacteriovoracaceae bacterium]